MAIEALQLEEDDVIEAEVNSIEQERLENSLMVMEVEQEVQTKEINDDQFSINHNFFLDIRFLWNLHQTFSFNDIFLKHLILILEYVFKKFWFSDFGPRNGRRVREPVS